jgi:hypothetical protein
MHSRLTSYLNKYNFLYDYQFGFRKNHSTSLAVVDVISMIQNELYNGKLIMGVFMDLQKAFDTVNFSILIDKLEHYGIRETCLNWFKTYLIGRTQFTIVNTYSSNVIKTSCGIPQGTVLGPLLFLLYINDIVNSTTNSQIKLFADDSNLFIIGDNIDVLYEVANKELCNLSRWVCANKLHINYDKTNFMIFQPRSVKASVSVTAKKLIFNNHIIDQVHSVKYLGILIDDKLSWTDHINYVTGKISSVIGILYRFKHVLPMNCKRNIYFSLIYSNLIYGVEVYANTNYIHLKPLTVKCNRLLRMLQNKSRRTHLYDLYSTFNTLPVDLLFKYYTVKFMHRCLYDTANIPKVISNWFTRGSDIHFHNTRHKNNFFIKSNLNPKSILFYGPSLWSKLPPDLQNNSNINSFLKFYKKLLLSNLR